MSASALLESTTWSEGSDCEDVEALFAEGWRLHQGGDVDEAIRQFSRILKLDPNHIKASYARGACFNLKGAYAEAIDDYTAALEKDVRERRRRLRTQLSWPSRFEKKIQPTKPPQPTVFRGDKAPEKKLTNNVTKDSGVTDVKLKERPSSSQENNANASAAESPIQHTQKKSAPSEEASPEGAKPERDDPIATAPPPAKEPVAATPPQSASLEDVEVPVDVAVPFGDSLEPRNPASDEQRWREIEDITKRLVLAPNDGALRSKRASLFAQVGELHEAIYDYSEALIYSSTDPVLYFNRGILHDACFSFAAAHCDYTAAILLNPHNPNYFNNRGLTLRKQGHLLAALDDYAKALSLQPNHSYALQNQHIAHQILSTLSSKLL